MLIVASHVLGSGSTHSTAHSPEAVVQCLHRIHFPQGCSCVRVDGCRWLHKDCTLCYKDLGFVRVLHVSGFVHRMDCNMRAPLGHLLRQSEFSRHTKNA